MKILGIGNAIVDVICKVDDQYLIDNELIKSTMKLVDETEFQKLLSTLKSCSKLFLVGRLQILLLVYRSLAMMLGL